MTKLFDRLHVGLTALLALALALVACQAEEAPAEEDNTYYKATMKGDDGYVHFYTGKYLQPYIESGELYKEHPDIPHVYRHIVISEELLEQAKQQAGDPLTLKLCNPDNDITIYWNQSSSACDGKPTLEGCDIITGWHLVEFKAGAPGVFGIASIYVNDGTWTDGYEDLEFCVYHSITTGTKHEMYPDCPYYYEQSWYTSLACGQAAKDSTLEDESQCDDYLVGPSHDFPVEYCESLLDETGVKVQGM